MSADIVRPEFDVVAARARHSQLSAPIPRGLSINRSNVNWTQDWDRMIGQSPQSFYETLCRHIDGEVSVYIDFAETEEENFNINIKRNGRFVFEAENKIVTDGRGKILRFEEWANKDADSKGRGMGLNLFRNIFEIAQCSGIDHIELRAGREDGKYFWARHGFYLKAEHFRVKMADQIRENLVRYSETLPVGIKNLVEEILDECQMDMCWKVARIEGMLEAKPMGWKMLEGYNPEYCLNLRDEDQVERVKSSLVRPSALASALPGPSIA